MCCSLSKVVSSQHGVTKGKSWLTSLKIFFVEMTGSVHKGRNVDVIGFGFCKVLGMVSHCVLAAKLVGYGLDSWALRWM